MDTKPAPDRELQEAADQFVSAVADGLVTQVRAQAETERQRLDQLSQSVQVQLQAFQTGLQALRQKSEGDQQQLRQDLAALSRTDVESQARVAALMAQCRVDIAGVSQAVSGAQERLVAQIKDLQQEAQISTATVTDIKKAQRELSAEIGHVRREIAASHQLILRVAAEQKTMAEHQARLVRLALGAATLAAGTGLLALFMGQ